MAQRIVKHQIPTTLIERGQPDKTIAELGIQPYYEDPSADRRNPQYVTLNDGKMYVIHRVKIHGTRYSEVEVRLPD